MLPSSSMSQSKLKSSAKLRLRKHRKLYSLYTQNFFRVLTSPIRVLPDFIIIGGIKCGTTSLYNYMIQHPNIYSALRKESKFFDLDYKLGLNWYKPNFPTNIKKYFVKNILKQKFLTGEATPAYFHHPLVPKRIFEKMPKIKLIVLLRNPIDRAYSDFNMRARGKAEKLPFDKAVEQELSLIAQGRNLLANLEFQDYLSYFKPYLSRGYYYNQLQLWFEFFPKDNIQILITEEFNLYPDNSLKQTFKFLGLPELEIKNLKKQNVGKYEEMNTKLRSLLVEHFKPQNQKLYKFLGRDLNWDK